MMDKNNKISRSQIELFIECPRCFWLDVKFKIKRPQKFSGGYIGSKYDPLLKNYFDKHRENNETPEDIKKHNLNLFSDIETLKIWRGKGIEYFHERHNVVYYGKIDDLLTKDDYLIPFDFKATISKNFQIYEDYKRQLEIYGYLLKKNNYQVLNIGVLYVVKIDIDENFEKQEEKEVILIEDLNYDIYDEILDKLIEVYNSDKEPDPNPDCEFCKRDIEIINFKQNSKREN
jgi:hypothetical protein